MERRKGNGKRKGKRNDDVRVGGKEMWVWFALIAGERVLTVLPQRAAGAAECCGGSGVLVFRSDKSSFRGGGVVVRLV